MAAISEPSVQSLLIEMHFNNQKLSSGTAFVAQSAAGPVLVTNRHNVTGRNQDTGQPLSSTGGIPDRLAIVHNRTGRLGQWLPKFENLYAGDRPRWKEHPALGARADFVALP
jgi:hypothetical protein